MVEVGLLAATSGFGFSAFVGVNWYHISLRGQADEDGTGGTLILNSESD